MERTSFATLRVLGNTRKEQEEDFVYKLP